MSQSEFSPRIALLVACALWGVSYVATMFLYAGPSLPDNESPTNDELSETRAIETLGKIIGPEIPHPVDTPENDQVRERLIQELKVIGLQISTQAGKHVEKGIPTDVDLINVIAKFPNSPNEGIPLLLVTHYDSCPQGPGAGDAGSCIAALIEAARTLVKDQLTRPTYLVFTEGEERGLWGAKLFVREHPLAKTSPIVLNFDARGSNGASLMYETTLNNRGWITATANRLPHPRLTGSAFVEIYRLMPNGSDFTEFAKCASAGGNFALIGGVHRYHTAIDTIPNLDPRSVRHHGLNALYLARELQGVEESVLKSQEDLVFFDFFGLYVISYSQLFARILASAALLLLFFGKSEGTWLEMIQASWRVLLVIIVSVVSMIGLSYATREVSMRSLGGVEEAKFWGGVTIGITWAVAILVVLILTRLLISSDRTLIVGKAVWRFWAVLGVLATWTIPGVSYFAVVPALTATASLPIRDRNLRNMVSMCGAAITLVPALYLFPIAMRPIAASIYGPVFAIALSMFIPLFAAIEPRGGTRTIREEQSDLVPKQS